MAGYVPEGLRSNRAAQPGQRGASKPAGLGPVGWLRWAWRQLTSMRVALMLLLLLAVVSLPGAFFPQRPQDPAGVLDYLESNPGVGPWLDRLGLFDVYASPWFSAVYLLLFASLIGCIVPRTWAHAQALRSGPSRVPRSFTRFPTRRRTTVQASARQLTSDIQHALGRGYRHRASRVDGAVEISAERGYGRETGNLVFHLALVGLLVVTAWGQLVAYRGQAIVVAGQAMVNSAVDYDTFDSGAWFDSASQEPFRIQLDSFTARFTHTARADEFIADVTLTRPDGEPSATQIKVNEPLQVGSANVYLTGNGYAPEITVTDADGEIAFSGPVLFLPQDGVYTSTGVILAPDANRGDPQLAFSGQLFPTAIRAEDGIAIGSAFPLPGDPALSLTMWTGDLGLDDGMPQNLYVLDTAGLDQVADPDDPTRPWRVELAPGQTAELPDGQGSITFGELRRYVALDVRWDPSVPWMGVFAALAVAGLAASLFLPRRRIWFRLRPGPDGTVVHAAALARGDDPGLQREFDRVLNAVTESKPAPGADAPKKESGTDG
ncbi:MAG: cytochrome c biogenesis protein ResB [Beutenbergiaceae bacterium]